MITQELENRLKQELLSEYVEVIDESGGHVGHMGAMMGGGHFRAVIVSPKFENLSLIDRHRLVYQAIGMPNNPAIHAFSMKTFTPQEWEKAKS